MSERWLYALPLFACCAAGLWLARRLSAVSPLIFALGLTALMGTFYPLATLAVTPITWRNVRDVPEEVVLGVQRDYLAFGAGMLAALVLAHLAGALRPRGAREGVRARTAGERRRDLVVAWGLFGGGTALYALYVHAVGIGALLDKVDLAEKYRLSSGLGPLMLGINLVIAGCLWAEAAFQGARAKLPFRLAALAVVVWSLAFIAVRSYSVAVLLGYLYLFCVRRGIELRRLRPRVVLLLLALYLVVETYAHVRGSWDGDPEQLLEAVQDLETASKITVGQIVGGSELSHPFITAMEIERYEEPGALGGASYAEAVGTFVPLALVPDRPPTLAQSFADEYYPLVSERGGGTAFSLVAEAWWNFGPLVGPFAIGALLAAALAALAACVRRNPHGIAARLVPYGLFLVLALHRSTLGTSCKQLTMILLPVLALASAAWLLGSALEPRHAPRQARRGGLAPVRGA